MSDKQAARIAQIVLVIVMVLGTMFVIDQVLGDANDAVTTVTVITEDDDRWDCHRMGNRICSTTTTIVYVDCKPMPTAFRWLGPDGWEIRGQMTAEETIEWAAKMDRNGCFDHLRSQ